ncbi:MAG: zf-TFIIB domain-containing protein [Proteobacteria bacterium]|nr:zf-TFIIB domain-containing protein [Pseudomonadota bacterium]
MDLVCPSCQDQPLAVAGRTMRCEVCDGAWINEETLVALLEERTNSLVTLPWSERLGDKQMPCAACKAPMLTVNLGDVALDRCAQHGVWFDAHELVSLLKQSKRFKTEADAEVTEPPHEHHGLLGVFARLFRR